MFVAKKAISRNFRYPSAELREKVRAAVKERGFRSEQAFLIAACANELRRGENTEAVTQFESRMAATLNNHGKTVARASHARASAGRPDRRALEIRHYLCCGTPGRCAPRGARSRQVAI